MIDIFSYVENLKIYNSSEYFKNEINSINSYLFAK